MQQWKENELDGYMTLTVDDFDVEHNLEELEQLLEESDYEEKKRLSEEAPQCGSQKIYDITKKKEAPRHGNQKPMMWPMNKAKNQVSSPYLIIWSTFSTFPRR